MKTKPWAIALVFMCTLLTSMATTMYKLGANQLSFDIRSIVTNVPLFLGIFLYVVSSGVLLIALKNGELSVLYPIISMSYVWVSILSFYIFKEVINVYKLAGISFIILGVSLIGVGSRK